MTQYRSPESVISEMKYLKENYWNTHKEFDYSASANIESKRKLIIKDNTLVYFVDDVFTVKKDRVKKILRMMLDQNLEMDWKCEARTDHLDEEICALMAESGCVRVKLGFESGSERILRMIQKDETIDDMREGAKMLKEAGVPFTAYFMAGFPDETDEANGVDIGYFIISKQVLDLQMSGNVSFEVDILPQFIARKQLGAYVTDTQYYYITNMQTLKNFEVDAKTNNFLPLPKKYFGG